MGRLSWLHAPRGFFVLTATLIFALCLIAPVNHDESQYLASLRLGATMRPFVDFLYLQTPYQIYLFSPVMAWFPQGGFIAMRMVTAAMGLVILLLVYGGQRALGVTTPRAVAATAGLLACYGFLFSVTLVRNDALPALALAFALWLYLVHGSGAVVCLICGLLLGYATGVKLSYAVPAAGFGMALLVIAWRNRQDRAGVCLQPMACLVGGLAALAPLWVIRAGAPDAFDFGIFTFAFKAPAYWYELNGMGARLSMGRKLVDLVVALGIGPALPVLGILVWRTWNRRKSRTRNNVEIMLDLMIVAGLVAAFLPTPTWRQYVMPVLPPLFIRLGLMLQQAADEAQPVPRLLRWLTVTCAMIGMIPVVIWFAQVRGKAGPLAMTREAYWVGEQVRANATRGSGWVATLSPQAVVDSGVPLDPRFAAGPFAYRSAAVVEPEQWPHLKMAGRGEPERAFPTRPAAILVGYEDGDVLDRVRLDADLRAYAVRHCYAYRRSPYGEAELYLIPASGALCSTR